MKSFSFFEVDSDFSDILIKSLNKKKFENFVIKVEKSKPAPRHKKDRFKKENYKARSSSRPKNRLRQSFAKRKYRKKKN